MSGHDPPNRVITRSQTQGLKSLSLDPVHPETMTATGHMDINTSIEAIMAETDITTLQTLATSNPHQTALAIIRLRNDLHEQLQRVGRRNESIEQGNKELARLTAEVSNLQENNRCLMKMNMDLVSTLRASASTTARPEPQATLAPPVAPVIPSTEQPDRPARSVSPTTAKRTVKIPDPPVYSSNETMPIESWILLMRGKLTANADIYPNEEVKVTYIFSRVAGSARSHLEPRMLARSIPDADAALGYLLRVFADPARKNKAKDKYRRLRQARRPFAEFWAEFQTLAMEAGIRDEEMQLDDLRDKISDELTVALANHEPMDLYDFANLCQSTEINLARTYQFKKDHAPRTTRLTEDPAARWSTPARTTAPIATTTVPARPLQTPTPGPRLFRPAHPDPERERLMKEGRCFRCKDLGHMSNACPKFLPAARVSAAPPVTADPAIMDPTSEKGLSPY